MRFEEYCRAIADKTPRRSISTILREWDTEAAENTVGRFYSDPESWVASQPQILALLKVGRGHERILAVREVRSLTGCGLKEAVLATDPFRPVAVSAS